jgi:hypothetical protein
MTPRPPRYVGCTVHNGGARLAKTGPAARRVFQDLTVGADLDELREVGLAAASWLSVVAAEVRRMPTNWLPALPVYGPVISPGTAFQQAVVPRWVSLLPGFRSLSLPFQSEVVDPLSMLPAKSGCRSAGCRPRCQCAEPAPRTPPLPP